MRRSGSSSAPPADRPRQDEPPPRTWWSLVPVLAFVAFVAVMVGPTLGGDRVFAAGELLERRAPWAATSTVDEPSVNLCVTDTIDQGFASALEARGRMLDGDWPRWNDEVLGGSPLAETPLHGVLSPIVLGTLFLPPHLFPGWAKVLELTVMLAGCVLLGRRLGLGVGPSSFVALAFAASGFAVMWNNWPQARTIAFFPLVLWALERVLQERTLRSAWPLPLVAAGTVLGGFPALVVYLVHLLVFWTAVRLFATVRTAGWRSAGTTLLVLVAAGAATLALLATQILAMGLWLLEADLGNRTSLRSGVDLQPTKASSVLFPQALGTCAEDTPFWGPVTPIEGVGFVGVAVAALALLSLFLPRFGGRWSTGLLGVLWGTVVLSFGASYVASPFIDLIGLLPGVDGSPIGRTRAVGGLALALLAALGLRSVLALRSRPAPARLGLAALALLALAGSGAGTLWFARRAAPDAEAWEAVLPTLVPGLVSFVLAGVLWLSLWRPGRLTRLLAGLLVVAATVEALVFAAAFWSRPPADTFYRTTDTHRFLQENLDEERMAGVGLTMFPGSETAYDIRSLTGHTFTAPRWNEVVTRSDRRARYSPSLTRLTGPEAFDAPGLDRLSVRYLVLDPNAAPPGEDVTVDLPAADSEVLLVPGGPRYVSLQRVDLASVYVDVVQETSDDVSVTVTAYDGRTVLDTHEVLVPQGRSGRFHVPLLDADGVTAVTVSVDGPLRVRGNAEGRVWLGLLGPVDGVRLAHRGGALVYENEDALPRYRWASEGAFQLDPRQRAWLVGSTAYAPEIAVTADPRLRFDGRPAEVRVVRSDPDHRVVEVDAEGAGVLVVADALTSGWTVTVGGEPAQLVEVDHALMGVPVPEGRHRVEIRFTGNVPTVLYGVSAAAALLVLVWAGWGLLRPRPDRRSVAEGGPPEASGAHP